MDVPTKRHGTLILASSRSTPVRERSSATTTFNMLRFADRSALEPAPSLAARERLGSEGDRTTLNRISRYQASHLAR